MGHSLAGSSSPLLEWATSGPSLPGAGITRWDGLRVAQLHARGAMSTPNIYLLDWDVNVNARWHDPHSLTISSVGDILRTTDAWLTGRDAAWINHPWAVWARMNLVHWIYLRQLWRALEARKVAWGIPGGGPEPETPSLPSGTWINPPLVIPREYHVGSVIVAHRLHYAALEWAWSRPWWVPLCRPHFTPVIVHPDTRVPRGMAVVRRGPKTEILGWVDRMWRSRGIIRREYGGRDLLCRCDYRVCTSEAIRIIANSVGAYRPRELAEWTDRALRHSTVTQEAK